MTPELWWHRRADSARALMEGCFSHGMGRMERVEPRMAALAMINRAYSMIWQGIHQADSERRAAAGEWVDGRLGIGGVIGGQAYDLSGWRGEQCAAEVSEVAARKTGDFAA